MKRSLPVLITSLALMCAGIALAAPKVYQKGDTVQDFALRNAQNRLVHLKQFPHHIIALCFYGFY